MIQAIETAYKGCRFRSRTEARWAVFLDAMGLQWQYELEGFDLPDAGGYYLPDFKLAGPGYWLEIKGSWPPKDEEFHKCRLLSLGTKTPVIMLGPVDNLATCEDFGMGITCYYSSDGHLMMEVGQVLWGQCPSCYSPCLCINKAYVGLEARAYDVDALDAYADNSRWQLFCLTNLRCNNIYKYFDPNKHREEYRPSQRPLVREAYQAALSARFEHGEKPRVPRGKPRNK